MVSPPKTEMSRVNWHFDFCRDVVEPALVRLISADIGPSVTEESRYLFRDHTFGRQFCGCGVAGTFQGGTRCHRSCVCALRWFAHR